MLTGRCYIGPEADQATAHVATNDAFFVRRCAGRRQDK